MKKLALLNPENVSNTKAETFKVREAARAVVFDGEGKIALLNVTKHGYHKLPGGGIESGESKEEALKRECLEEIGCEIEITGELGEIEEYRKQFGVRQISYGYLAKIVGRKGEPSFVEEEIEEGFQIEWQILDRAIELLQSEHPTDYMGRFVVERDLIYWRSPYPAACRGAPLRQV